MLALYFYKINHLIIIFFLISILMYYKFYFMTKKKTFSTRIDQEILKALKHLAVDLDKSLGVLLEEAIKDLLKKYRTT